MRKFKNLVKEINVTLTQLIIFSVAVNTILIFLSVYLVLSIFNLYPLIALVPAVVYFGSAFIKKSKINKMRAVENKYSDLKEKLRTAVDNADQDNPVVNELKEEVMDEVKQVGVSSFIKPKNISYKILACIIISFGIVFASTFHLSFLDVDNLLSQMPELIEKARQAGAKATAGIEEVNLTEDIYGDKELASLGNEEINIKIKPANYKVSVKEAGDIEEKQFDEMALGDVFVESSETFDEDIPLEEQELVKDYFNKITG